MTYFDRNRNNPASAVLRGELTKADVPDADVMRQMLVELQRVTEILAERSEATRSHRGTVSQPTKGADKSLGELIAKLEGMRTRAEPLESFEALGKATKDGIANWEDVDLNSHGSVNGTPTPQRQEIAKRDARRTMRLRGIAI